MRVASREPVVGTIERPVDARAVEDELTEAAVVAQRHGEAAAALLVADVIDHPLGVALHAVGAPDLFRQVVGERLPVASATSTPTRFVSDVL